MTDHLPECYQYEHSTQHMDSYWCDSDCEADCICDLLRACEQRVREEYATDWQTEQESVHLFGLDLAYLKGVERARDAVAKLPINGYHPIEVHNTVIDALAAIDALMEDK